MYSSQKKFLAFLLTAAMILSNIGTGLNVSYAGTADQITFQIRGADLVSAVEEAIHNGQEMSVEDLGFTNGKTAEFEKIFINEKGGPVYEIYPEMEGGGMEAELRMFVCLPADADDMYIVTGEEEIILLYVNNGEETISCTTEISRMDEGQEKVKKTKRVTIRSYEDAFGDEEVDIISRPAQETQTEETTISQESGAEETTVPPVSSESGNHAGDVTDGSSESGTSAETKAEAPAPDRNEAEPSETSQEVKTEAADKGGDSEQKEEKAVEEEKVQKEEKAEKEALSDKEEKAGEEDKSGETTGPIASISRHVAPIVADDEENSQKADVEPETREKETKAKEENVIEKEKEPKTQESETAKEESPEAPQESPEVSEESSEKDTESATEANTSETDTPDTDEDRPAPTTSADIADDSTISTAHMPSESETVPAADVSAPTESERETTAAAEIEDGVKKADTSDLVGMGYCSTAKVYTATLNQLKALEDFEGYRVTYASYPEASARILEGTRGVKEGGSFTFGVKTQAGYTIDYVTVNSQVAEADSTDHNEDGSQTAWFTVQEVYEEQEVEIYTLETMEHPAFDKSVEVNGVTIRITAPEGVLPGDTQIQAEEITRQVESAVMEKVTAETGDGTSVTTVIAYDINLMYNGLKLDNSWAGEENHYVTVSFSGERITQASKEADQIEILHLETPVEEVEAVSAKAELEGSQDTAAVAEVPVVEHLTADDISVDSEGRKELDVSGDASVGKIDFTTDHFSAFTVVFKNSPHLLIVNELSDESIGADDIRYTYEVSITDSRNNKNEKLYLLSGSNEAEEYKDAEMAASGDTNTYTFHLSPGGQMKIGNVGPNAAYKVTQKELENNQLLNVTANIDGIDWTQTDTETSGGTAAEETFPYGYDFAEGAYSSLMERASALLRSFSKCKSDHERKALLDTTKLGAWNDQLRKKLLEDHGLSEWPLAADEGFGDVAGAAQANLDQNGLDEAKQIDLEDAGRLNIYFRIVAVNSDKLDSPGNMEIVPYLSMNRTDDNSYDGIGNWTAYAAYNSEDKSWYQYLSKHEYQKHYEAGSFDLHKKNADMVIKKGSQKDHWHYLMSGDLDTMAPDTVGSTTEGSFTGSGIASKVSLTFQNYYDNGGREDSGNGDKDNGDHSPSGDKEDQLPDAPGEDSADTTPEPPSDNTVDPPAGHTPDRSSEGSWSGNKGSGGSGGAAENSTSGRYEAGSVQSGPGVTQSEIQPSEVPLAALPSDASAAASQAIAVIDDGEIPMAAIPRTGNNGNSAHELTFLLSGVLLAVYTALAKRKKTS